MYDELFQSPNRPFRATPDTRFYFPYESMETARQTVVRAMIRAEGPAMVLGGAGFGKTLLGEVIAEDLATRMDIVKLQAARLCSRRALLQSILFELQLPYRDLSEGELRLSILDRLEPSPETAPDGVLIIVDEAHTLHAKLLDELRLINNFTRNNQPRTRLLLLGSMRLEDTLAQPQMDSFNQRLAARCYLQPMNRQATYDFVRHQLAEAGVDPKTVITSDGLDAVYSACEGVPRLVNQIMDHALVLAMANNQAPISSPLIEEAWADLQQLPAPWHSANESTAGVPSEIEFGSLDESEEDEDAPVAFQYPQASKEPSLTSSEVAYDDGTPEIEVPEAYEPFAESNMPNFFAAFVAPPEGIDADLESSHFDEVESKDSQDGLVADTDDSEVIESHSAQADAYGEQTVESAEAESTPRIVFDASVAFQTNKQTTPATGDAFFADRPTDEELLALEDEQLQYDALGVWENDPPLRAVYHETQTPAPQAQKEVSPSETVLSTPRGHQPNHSPTSALFGEDFDEEIMVGSSEFTSPATESGNNSPAVTQPVVQQKIDVDADSAIDSKEVAREAAEYVARIQQFAESFEGMGPRIEEFSSLNTDLDLSNETSIEGWSVNVATTDLAAESELVNEIEDLVSQLNFSAFSVEPFSVEQISLDATPSVSKVPEDSIRTGENAEIYMLHRAESNCEDVGSLFSEAYDDDRDLLIVEDELPASGKTIEATSNSQQTSRPAPYSQLFAKLRK